MRTEWKGNAGCVVREVNALSEWMEDMFSTKVGAFCIERGH